MKNLFLVVIFLIMSNYVYSQEVVYVKGKNYEGYIFSKEYLILGFPSEKDRYTPSPEDITQAEKILKNSINTDYVKDNQKQYIKPPINNKTLKKYVRQYVGYLTEEGEIIIHIYLNKGLEISKDRLSEDIIMVADGGINHWRININLSTKRLSAMNINGIS